MDKRVDTRQLENFQYFEENVAKHAFYNITFSKGRILVEEKKSLMNIWREQRRKLRKLNLSLDLYLGTSISRYYRHLRACKHRFSIEK